MDAALIGTTLTRTTPVEVNVWDGWPLTVTESGVAVTVVFTCSAATALAPTPVSVTLAIIEPDRNSTLYVTPEMTGNPAFTASFISVFCVSVRVLSVPGKVISTTMSATMLAEDEVHDLHSVVQTLGAVQLDSDTAGGQEHTCSTVS